MKLLTVLGVVLLITTGTWAYPRNCAKGPKYWCRDASTAEACGAVRHCEQTVWRENRNNKPSMTMKETAEMLCNVLVQASKKVLDENVVKADSIKEYLRNDCNKLPKENHLIEHCQRAVDIYLSDILRHIQTGTESTKICPLIQGHDAASSFVPKPKVNNLASNATCILCEFVLHLVEAAASANASEQELIHIFEQVCIQMPSTIRNECKSFVDQYAADIIALLVREIDPAKVCELIKICPKPKNVAFLTKPNLETCGLCEYVSTYITSGHPIENVCTHFATENNLRQQCEILVRLYKPNMCPELPLCFDETQSESINANPLECSLCKFVVNYVDTVIQNNRSEAAIEAALEKVCTILPHALNSSCVQFVENFGPILVQLLEKYITPDQVCAAIEACTNATLDIALQEYIDLNANPLECTLCKFVVNYVDTIIQNNRTEAAIEAALDKVCTILPHSLNSSCVKFVQQYGPVLVQLIEQYVTADQVCAAIKACTNATQEIPLLPQFQPAQSKTVTPNSVQCTLCEFIVTYVDKAIGSNRSEAAIDAELQKVCNNLPSSVRPNCTTFVKTFGPFITLLLAKNETPAQVCDFLRVCHNGTEDIQPIVLDVNSVECTICKYVVSYVAAVIADNKSEAAIEAALEKVCTILPHSLNKSCVEFVITFGPKLVQLIEKYNDSVKVCDALKLCNNGTEEVQPKVLDVNSAECSVCKYVVSYVVHIVADNKSEAAIEAALEKVCTILPHSLNKSCVQFVVTFGPKLVELIEKYNDSVKVCDALKLCNNGTEEIQPKVLDVNSAECSLCKYVVSYVETVVADNKSEAAIEAALEKVCSILPHSLNKSCVQFVVTFGPKLVELIEKYNDSVKVCDALKLCNNGTEEIITAQSVRTRESLSVNSAQCTLCEFIIGYVEKTVGNNHSAAAVDAALDKVCDILPSSVRPNCTSFVKKFGLPIAVLIAKNDTPAQICDFLQVCKNGTEEIQPKVLDVNSAECSVCKYVVSYVAHVVADNKSEAAIEAALEKVCSILPHSLNKSCVQFVVTFGPKLVELIEKYDDPVKVCDSLKLCKNGTEEVSQVVPGEVKQEEVSVSSPQCSLCKLVVTYLELIIENNKTEAAIEAALEKVCSILPSEKKAECVKFVDTYGAKLVELLEKFGSPKLVCAALGLCVADKPEITPIQYAASTQCSLCKYVVAYVDAVIQTNRSEAAIDAALEKVCTILPHSLNKSCVQFIDTFGPELVEYIAKYATPTAVCDQMKLCKNGTEIAKPVPQIQIPSVKDTVECTLCKYVVSFVNVLIQNNATEQEIIKGLEVVCKLLPKSQEPKCDTFVQTYGPILAELIAELDDPNVVCQYLSMCKKSDDKFIEIPSPKAHKLQSLPCNLCQYLVNYLDAIIQSNSTETKFEEELEKACKILPSTKMQAECRTFTDRFGLDIIKLLVELGNPKTVCQELGICDK